MYPHRALEKGKREVKNSFGSCLERIQKEYCSRVGTMAEQTRQNEAKEKQTGAKRAQAAQSGLRAYRQAICVEDDLWDKQKQRRRNSVQAQSSTSKKDRSACDNLCDIATWFNNELIYSNNFPKI